jgi:hypothetical protein
MKMFIGMDDTDVVGSTVGTGHLARMIAADLAPCGVVGYGISRHQLLFDRRIPYTAKNSSNVILVEESTADPSALEIGRAHV